MVEIEDKEWLDLLAGRPVSSNNSNKRRNVEALRTVIKKFAAEDLAQVDGLKKMMSRMTMEGLFLEKSELTATMKIIRFVKKIRLLIIFIIGIISGVILPFQQLATRGGTDEPIFWLDLNGKNNSVNSEISLTVNAPTSPLELAGMIQLAAIESNLEVKTSGILDSTGNKNIKGIEMIVYGLKSMDESQIRLKILLQATNQLSGTVKVTIKSNQE